MLSHSSRGEQEQVAQKRENFLKRSPSAVLLHESPSKISMNLSMGSINIDSISQSSTAAYQSFLNRYNRCVVALVQLLTKRLTLFYRGENNLS